MRKFVNSSMQHVDRRLGAVLTLFALVWIWLAYTQIPDAGSEWPGPRGFPLLLGVTLAGLGVWMMMAPGTSNPEPGSRIPDPGSRPASPGSRRELAVAGGTFGVLVLYAFLLERAGFLIATPLVIVLIMAGLLGLRRWLPILSLAAGFTLGCWMIFEALGTPLPRGSWIV